MAEICDERGDGTRWTRAYQTRAGCEGRGRGGAKRGKRERGRKQGQARPLLVRECGPIRAPEASSRLLEHRYGQQAHQELQRLRRPGLGPRVDPELLRQLLRSALSRRDAGDLSDLLTMGGHRGPWALPSTHDDLPRALRAVHVAHDVD